ncbi:MAG: hypothetical protein KF832_03330 [Caldilineaceae bacterium]|nr:hypothetical protein [Caldilineaceae bacterium]
MTTYDDAERQEAPEEQPIIIKGSWEDLLQQAQQLAGSQNDDAIPLYEKIVQRLGKLSAPQRLANKERLQQIYLQASFQLHSYLTLRERYDEALAVLEQAKTLVQEEEEKDAIAYQQTMVLLMAGRTDEALAQLQAQATAVDADIADWGALVLQYLRNNRIREAETAMADATAWVTAKLAGDELDDESTKEYQSYLSDLRADLSMQKGEWDEAEAYYKAAIQQDALYKQNVHLFYMRLMQNGQAERALPYIQRDQQHPIRSGFWQGVAHHRLGQAEEAERQWQKVTKIDPSQSNEPSFSEMVLTHYYLGDPERIGLGTVLQVIQESRRYDWQTLFLAGLGWAIQGRLDSAEANFQVAVNQRRLTGQGKFLPKQVWDYCVDLLDETTREQVAKYFETKRPGE